MLLSVGILRMQKRLRVVMQAMTRLRTQEQLHYVICGEGPDMVFLQKLTEKLHLEERVHLLGYRTDIPDLLGAADIFCMPSRREGCGMAALEAMAAGLPLITVRNHGTKVYAEKGECLWPERRSGHSADALHSWQRISCSAGKWVPTTVPQ
ncbi:MAG: glycosyltransferase [Ruminococcus callidus]